jgi:hypothetical protein
MATLLSSIETQARRHLIESTASFWSSAELIDHVISGIRDLWRPTVDLKQEHYLTVDITNVSLAADTSQLTGVPLDVHKVYLIEPRDISASSANAGLIFTPKDFNHASFQGARARDDIDPKNDTIYYAITGPGAPVGAPTIRVAPQVTSAVNLSFSYVPTLGALASTSQVPIPGEADNALIAWTVAFARAKEREDRSPDPSWLAIYATEKNNLLQSLGLRQYQENSYVDAVFEQHW